MMRFFIIQAEPYFHDESGSEPVSCFPAGDAAK